MNRKFYTRLTLIAIILIIVASFYTLPYYVTKPGMAKELQSVVEVEGGDDSAGSFMLTTIRMGKANIFSYIMTKISKYQVLYPEASVRGDDETDQEYNIRQLHLMEGSKNSAIKVAYEEAGKSIKFKYLGVYVLNVIKGMPAAERLEAGDEIIKIDDFVFNSSKEFIDYVSKKDKGDTVSLLFKRGDEEMTADIQLQTFPKDNSGRVGIGISLEDDKVAITDPKIKVNTEQIGGPSAGLMFSLEIFDQLLSEDMTRGFQIAGTGTIDEDGKVGPIGGIQQKIVAADKAGAEIFFAPNEGGKKGSNYKEALVASKDIKTTMKIVPVDSFAEAVDYLKQLEPKS